MATAIITDSMKAQAQVLLERSSRWARGTRNSDGQAFVLFTSSRTDRDGNPIYHRTHAAGQGCTCPSWQHRGACSHALACQMDAERRERAASKPRRSYADLYGFCAEQGCQDERIKHSDFCERHALVDAF